jgi:putative redox protein
MTVHIQTEVPGKFRQVVTVDAHTLHADVDHATGGEATAPGAHDYFDISLATCKALTATWYARYKKMALDRVEATVERDDSREREGIYGLKVRLAFFGALSEAERTAIYNAVAKCPVHKLMTTSTVEITTEPL